LQVFSSHLSFALAEGQRRLGVMVAESCRRTDWNHFAVPPFDCPNNNERWRIKMGRGLLLWLIGIPIPIILVIWLFGGLG
jgi:hypothetical protein